MSKALATRCIARNRSGGQCKNKAIVGATVCRLTNARTLIAFCRRLGLPFGINVESLTNRKAEIEASVDLARDVRDLLR